MNGTTPTQLARVAWLERRATYQHRLRPWVESRLCRRSRHEKHPVYDFLFEYYSFPASQLLRWSPGFGVRLETAEPAELDWSALYESAVDGYQLPAARFPQHRVTYLNWARSYLDQVGSREPAFGCFGLHEWAMVYRTPEIRHTQIPLRLARTETDAVVDNSSLRCSHYDAFRFFTRDAVPLNKQRLLRETMAEHDQPGCIHVTMDLYKFAYKIAPFLASEILADAFELAIRARELDMRASPYDLAREGFTPIPIETRAGREQYVEEQRALCHAAQPVRAAIRDVYNRLLCAIEGI